MTDDDREKCSQAIMVAMWHAETSGGSPVQMADLTEAERAQRKEWADEALEKVIEIVGAEQAFRHIDHELICKVFMQGYDMGRDGKSLEGDSLTFITGLLMGATKGKANPAEIERILTGGRK